MRPSRGVAAAGGGALRPLAEVVAPGPIPARRVSSILSAMHRPVRLLASRRVRIFLVGWIVFSVHFATHVVREHYPAFALAERGTLRVDEYLGFHADIFEHTDGHAYVGNNVAVSVLAAVPLAVFDPVLDALEAREKARRAATGDELFSDYRTDKPNRVRFFERVREHGLSLRFGAATVVTSAFFMAPFSALSMVLVYHLLRRRRLGRGSATWLTFLYGFATPILFRGAHLNHNLFVMYALLAAFWLLWDPAGGGRALPLRRRLAAGFLAGFTLAVDYTGVFTLLALFAYLLAVELPRHGPAATVRRAVAFVAASVPPVAFLWWSQWAMYGHPFLPGQAWMPHQNAYVVYGWRGITLPSPDLFFLNLFDPWYGLFLFAPLLLLAAVPAPHLAAARRILPRRERRFVWATFLVLLTFFAANQYSRLQYNSGVRYLIPMVPFLLLLAGDHLLRLPRWAKVAVTAVAGLHSWVIAVFREPVFTSWRLFLEEGVQLPWLRVLRMTRPPGSAVERMPWLGAAIVAATAALCWAIWRLGAGAEARADDAAVGRAAAEEAA